MKGNLLLILALGLVACSSGVREETALDRPRVEAVPAARSPTLQVPRLQAVQGVEDGLIKAIEAHRVLLENLPDQALEPLLLRRVGDLLVEQGEQSLLAIDRLAEAEAPTVGEQALASDSRLQALYRLSEDSYKGAVAAYERLLGDYPRHELAAEALYQLARAHESLGQPEASLQALTRLSDEFPAYPRRAEVEFRRGELLFQDERFADASRAYSAVVKSAGSGRFSDQALYKLGWAEFKDKRYDPALDAFFQLLDRYLQGSASGAASLAALDIGQREQLEDTLRATYLSFSNQDGPVSIGRYLDRSGGRSYEDLLFRRLGEHYLEQQRYTDAAETFLAFAARHPGSDDAPRFHLLAVGAYAAGGFGQRTREAKIRFARAYAPDQPYWRGRDRTALSDVLDQLREVRAELARYHHARAQSGGQPAEYQQAEQWYGAYLADPPATPAAAEIAFLFGDLLFERQRPAEAVDAYERAAYEFGGHPTSAEAAYAAFLAYDAVEQNLTGEARSQWQRRTLASARRFAETYPGHAQMPAVLTRAAQAQLRLGELQGAERNARLVLEREPPADADLRRIAWTLAGHASFEQNAFARAETAYVEALALSGPQQDDLGALRERLAAAIYQQGEQALADGRTLEAARLFERVGSVVPDASIRATADFDAAAAFVQVAEWGAAIALLEGFDRRFPGHALNAEVDLKLALAYDQSGRQAQAAAQYEAMGRQVSREPALRQEMLRTAAQLYQTQDDRAGLARVWSYYLQAFPEPLGPAQEARWTLAGLAEQGGDVKQQQTWLQQLLRAHRRAGNPGDARLRYLAAQSSWLLAQPRLQAFASVRLVAPLQRNLARKRELMEAALKELGQAAEFGVAEVTTVATYQIADIYRQFSRALLESERPDNLNALELEQYGLLLEEQAFPFEEKAIDLHALNLGRARDGLFDQWIEKSRADLARLMPVRYARPERTAGFVDVIE